VKKILVATALSQLFFLPSVGYADYQGELSISYDRAEMSALETDTGRVKAAFYIDPVVTGGLPLGEASFLGRSSHVGFGYAETTNSEFDSVKVTDASVGVEYFGKATPIYFAFDYHRLSTDIDGLDEEIDELQAEANGSIELNAIEELADDIDGNDQTFFTLAGGALIGDNLLVGGKWNRVSVDKYTDIDSIGPMVRYVAMFGPGFAVNLEGEYTVSRLSDSESDSDGEGSGARTSIDFYFSRQFSLGAEYRFSEIEDIENTTAEFRAKIYFTDNLSLGASYAMTEVEIGPNVDKDVYSIEFAYRFGVGRSLLSTPDSPKAKQGRGQTSSSEGGSLACKGKYKHLFSLCN